MWTVSTKNREVRHSDMLIHFLPIGKGKNTGPSREMNCKIDNGGRTNLMSLDDYKNRVATHQGKIREKQNFLQVREFWKMSGNFCHLAHVREFVMTFFRLRLHHMVRDLPGLW